MAGRVSARSRALGVGTTICLPLRTAKVALPYPTPTHHTVLARVGGWAAGSEEHCGDKDGAVVGGLWALVYCMRRARAPLSRSYRRWGRGSRGGELGWGLEEREREGCSQWAPGPLLHAAGHAQP